MLKRVILQNQQATFDQIVDVLAEKGALDKLSRNTIRSYYTDLHGTLQIARDIGLLP